MRLTGKQPRRRTDGSWDYPPLAEALGEAGLEGISNLVTSRQNTVAQYILTLPILDLCDRDFGGRERGCLGGGGNRTE